MNTLSELYLGSEPKGVSVNDDQLVVTLANGTQVSIPLQVVGQFAAESSLPAETQMLILRHPPRIDHIHVTDNALNVYLVDGRTLSCPLAWFPRLLHGTPSERNNYELLGEDDLLHWPDLDEDIDIGRLFEGGKSTESESSIQQWLLSRQSQAVTSSVVK